MQTGSQLLPEWFPQEAIILAWPDEQTDWARWLPQVRRTYSSLIKAITHSGCRVLLLIRPGQIDGFKQLMPDLTGVLLLPADYNDTWVRDYGFLTCQQGKQLQPVEFTFNGWGNKFNAGKDNQINQQVLSPLCNQPLRTVGIVAEGGALEIDGSGHLLSTEFCLTNPERNGDMSLQAYQQTFADALGAKAFTVFRHGHLEGDDTDGHIDTLVRFTPHQGLVIQSAFNRPQDSHFEGLSALVNECRQQLPGHDILELPLPCVHNDEGERLPASYANYLINNDQILCPVYQQPEDQQALDVIAKAHPSHRIVAIDSLPLIQQFGSIHCISMQVPKGTLKTQVLNNLSEGVKIYA